APGVGKTHAMLLAGCERAAEGVDVVAASVQTHGRPESERLLERLESVPLCQVAHDGVRMWEMDTDAVLARKPALALVDDLAYVNSRGSKRFFRYQDIGQLLDAGIDVYTTLNVQH